MRHMQVPYLTPIAHYYRVFHRYTGHRILLFIAATVMTSVLSGFGIAALMPLLTYNAEDPASVDRFTQVLRSIPEGLGWGTSLLALLGFITVIYFVKAAFLFLQTLLRVLVSTGITQYLRDRLASACQSMSYPHYTRSSIGYLSNLITTEVGRTVAVFKQYSQLMISLANAFIFLGYSALLNWRLAAIAAIAGLLFLWPMKRLARSIKSLSILTTRQNTEIQSLLLQLVGSFKYLKATAGFGTLMNRVARGIDRQQSLSFRGQVMASIPNYSVEPLAVLVVGGLIYYHVGYKGEPLLATLVAVFFFDRAMRSVLQVHAVHQQFSHYLGGLLAMEKARQELEKNREEDTGELIGRFRRAIELKGVSFRFGDRTVLSEIDLTIERNRCLGIVGESGAGKTTLFDILTGLLDPESGSISIDGRDYAEIAKPSLRKRFGYVTQEPVIFDGTIRDNISLWDPREGSDERVRQAARAAYCEEFIREAERGYDTEIGERGVRLSGGQRQRLAIARELYWDPDILIFDEATSSLDSKSEEFIHRSIQNLRGEKTLILIAHRLATVRDCDTIVVLRKGRAVERGSWDELWADSDSLFSEMCRRQGVHESASRLR